MRFVLQHDYTAAHPMSQTSKHGNFWTYHGSAPSARYVEGSLTHIRTFRAHTVPTIRYDATVDQHMRA